MSYKVDTKGTTGHPDLHDDEYVRKGVASIFLEVEALGGKRKVKITERRTKIDWAHFIKEMLEKRYPDAEKVVHRAEVLSQKQRSKDFSFHHRGQ